MFKHANRLYTILMDLINPKFKLDWLTKKFQLKIKAWRPKFHNINIYWHNNVSHLGRKTWKKSEPLQM